MPNAKNEYIEEKSWKIGLELYALSNITKPSMWNKLCYGQAGGIEY